MSAERYLIIDPAGLQRPIDRQHPIGSSKFWNMVGKEALHEDYPPLTEEPEYLGICRKLGIAWEEMSDVGHMRYGPKGALVFDLLADYVQSVVCDLGLPLFQIKGTNMFDLESGPVAEHASLFGDRLYALADPDNGRRHVLRYAACHQQFAMIKHWQISHRHLPFAAYELADSYRLEQSGECMLAFRTRRLNMPDLHVFCRDNRQADDWFLQLHRRLMREVRLFGQDYELLVNVSSAAAMEQSRPLLAALAGELERPILVHQYPGDRNYYWTVNAEYHIIDALGRAREIGTVQIDVGNAQRFGIAYVDEQGQKQHPVILHSAVLGSIERFLYLLLDQAVRQVGAGAPGHLPFWLAPEQLRLLPVSDAHRPLADQLAAEISRAGIRVGVDDRPEKVGRKVRDAHADWVPWQAVVGRQEAAAGVLTVAERLSGQEVPLTSAELIGRLCLEQGDYPWRPLTFPALLSQRPVF